MLQYISLPARLTQEAWWDRTGINISCRLLNRCGLGTGWTQKPLTNTMRTSWRRSSLTFNLLPSPLLLLLKLALKCQKTSQNIHLERNIHSVQDTERPNYASLSKLRELWLDTCERTVCWYWIEQGARLKTNVICFNCLMKRSHFDHNSSSQVKQRM